MTTQQYEAHESLFSAAVKSRILQQVSRPSLSYWQDAWMRLKKNPLALISLITIIVLVLFVTMGSLLWTVDPAAQNIYLASTGPSLHLSAVVIDDSFFPENKTSDRVLEVPKESLVEVPAPTDFIPVGAPTTKGVLLQWTPVAGASGYVVYRSEVPPEGNSLGVPLDDITGGHRISYWDTATLEVKNYYYSIVSKNLDDVESTQSGVVAVDVKRGMSLLEALTLKPDAKIGDVVVLPTVPFGTDSLGRDVLARLIAGGRVSLFIGFFASLIFVLFGVLVGGVAGYFGGAVDTWISRIIDFVSGLPFLLLMILLKVVLSVGPGESGITALVIALVILSWTGTARIVRGQILQLRESEFVHASRLLGARPPYIIVRHLLPNLIGVILVSLTFSIPLSIFTEAFLSFIGLGVASPATSWGAMCTDGIQTILTRPHEFFFPAIFISVTVLAFNLLGDGLRDALDPRLRSGR